MKPPFVLPAMAAMLALAFAGCITVPHMPVAAAAPILYRWDDVPSDEPLRIVINLSAQRASYHRGETTVGWSFVATGKEGRNTPAGTYSITEKIEDKYSNRYGWIENDLGQTVDYDASPGDPIPTGCHYVAAPMPYWMRLTSYGIGMHAGIIPQPGEPASHGCIRLPKPFAPILFDNVQVGTSVLINH
jgi:lipoprotein-anchoring transpeptidase ErfK/SrfK